MFKRTIIGVKTCASHFVDYPFHPLFSRVILESFPLLVHSDYLDRESETIIILYHHRRPAARHDVKVSGASA